MIKAFSVSLDKRKQYWAELKQQAITVGVDVTPFIVGDGTTLPPEMYNSIDNPNPDLSGWGYGNKNFIVHHYNAFISHQKIIQIAKEQQLPCFLMLEDDAYITNRYTHVFNKFIESFSNLEFDILYLGWWIGNETDEWNLKIENDFNKSKQVQVMKATRLGGLHGAIINSSMYDYLLSLKPTDPIDCQLNQIHNQIKSYVLLPKIIHVRSIYSYCEGGTLTRKYL